MTPAEIALANQLIIDATKMSTLNLLTKLKELAQSTGGLNAIALHQGKKKTTFLHQLIEQGHEEIVEEYVRHLDAETLGQLINLQDSEGRNPLDMLGEYRPTSNILKSILTRAPAQRCSQALIAARPESTLERLCKGNPSCNEEVKQLILNKLTVADLNTVFEKTDILGSVSKQFSELIAKVDFNILQTRLTAISKIKSSPVLGNVGEPDIARVIALEKKSKEVFKAIMDRGVSLKSVYENLFTIDQNKLSSSLLSPSKVVAVSPLPLLLAFTLPFAVVGGLVSVAEQVTRTHGVHWDVEPGFVDQQLHDPLLLKLTEMEFSWMAGDQTYDMKKVLALKSRLNPQSEKNKQIEQGVYFSLLELCKQGAEGWQEKLAYLTQAARAGLKGAQAALSDYHFADVQQLNQALQSEKTEAKAKERLILLSGLGDDNAARVLNNFYQQRLKSLSRSDLTKNELQELKGMAQHNVAATIVLGRYYERLVKLKRDYKNEAFAAYCVARESNAGRHEIARCYCEGLVVEENIERGLRDYFTNALNGHVESKNALQDYVGKFANSLTHRSVLAIVLFELLSNPKVASPEFINASTLKPELVQSALFSTLRSYPDKLTEQQARAVTQNFCDHCPDSAMLVKKTALKNLRILSKNTEEESASSSSSTSTSIHESHVKYLNYQIEIPEKFSKYKGDIPDDLQNQNGELMTNPWICNDGFTYCLNADLPGLKVSPIDRTINLIKIAPDVKKRDACIEFVRKACEAVDKAEAVIVVAPAIVNAVMAGEASAVVNASVVINASVSVVTTDIVLPETPKDELVTYPTPATHNLDDDNDLQPTLAR